MNYKKRLAASLNFLGGAVALILGLGILPDSGCPASGCSSALVQTVFVILGILLVIDGLVCFVGFRLAFPAGGLLSVLVAGVVLFEWAGQVAPFHEALAIIALLALIADLLVMRSKSKLPAGSHPMDMPVFG